MRALLATSIGVTCAAALTLPLAVPAPAVPVPVPARAAHEPGTPAATAADPPGSTQSLPLSPLTGAGDRATGESTGSSVPPAVTGQGLKQRDARRFSLVGVVWDDPGAELHGTVQVRVRAADTGEWTGWQDLETHNTEHAADPGSAESEAATVRGSTAPLWVGDSDGIEVRVRPEAVGRQDRSTTAAPLPAGLRAELVDPGDDPQQPPDITTTVPVTEGTDVTEATDPTTTVPGTGIGTGTGATDATEATGPTDLTEATEATEVQPGPLPESAGMTMEAAESSAVNTDVAPLGATEISALSKAETEEQADVAAAAKPFVGPRPGIVTRKGWGADEKLRERTFAYTNTVKAAFIHHSATGNNYKCSQAPSVLRGIYRYHVKSSGWRDIGYNFAIDKCGNIYEGRAGGVTRPVKGAHTLGFNSNSMGIAVLGTFTSSNPPAAAVTAVAKLTAWKLGLYGRNPKGKVTLVSGGSNKYKKGKKVKLNVISGHRDGFATECPGARLYKKLGTARTTSARLQGR